MLMQPSQLMFKTCAAPACGLMVVLPACLGIKAGPLRHKAVWQEGAQRERE